MNQIAFDSSDRTLNYYNYFSEIETLFIRRRGRNLLLSPLDWALIETWQEREVPLHIILSGIERVFDQADKQAGRKRPIKSLLYCKEEIEARYAEWLERQVGKNGAQPPVEKNDRARSELFSAEMLAEHLATSLSEIRRARETANGDWALTLDRVFDRLTRLEAETHTTEALENELEKLDRQLDERLLADFETDALKTEIARQIAAYKTKMEPEVYQRTFDLMLLKRLREQRGVPRLSLFNL